MKPWHRFKLASLGLVVVSSLVLSIHHPVLAADDCGDLGEGIDNAPEYVAGPTESYTLEQPFGGKATVANIGEYIQTVYQFALGIVGIFAVVLIMFGGLRWVAAAGNESVIGEAKEIIISAVTGLVIALLSYSILAFINPQTLSTDVTVFKIPIPIRCSYEDPVTAPIPTITPGLNPNGHSLCSGAVIALENVVEVMLNGTDGPGGEPGVCPGCTLDISSGVRTHEKQAALRSCYDRAVASGNPDVCPSGCSSCNLAEKVCCSEHEHAKAVDVALTGVTKSGYLSSSDGYRKTSQNNGGKGGTVTLTCTGVPNPELCENQKLLNQIMTATGEFKGVSSEWWHFNFTGSCGDATSADGSAASACTAGTTAADGSKTAAEGYCYAYDGSTKYYHYAVCADTGASCGAWSGLSWFYISSGDCTSDTTTISYYEFDEDDAAEDEELGVYSAVPRCNTMTLDFGGI